MKPAACIVLVVLASGSVPLGLAQGKKGKSEEVLKVDGKLTTEDPKDKVRTSCHHKVHTLKMEEGGVYTIDLVSDDFDAYLRLEDSQEKELAKNDDIKSGDFNSRIIFKCDRGDTYRIIVTTFGRGETGKYKLTVTRPVEKKEKQ